MVGRGDRIYWLKNSEAGQGNVVQLLRWYFREKLAAVLRHHTDTLTNPFAIVFSSFLGKISITVFLFPISIII